MQTMLEIFGGGAPANNAPERLLKKNCGFTLINVILNLFQDLKRNSIKCRVDLPKQKGILRQWRRQSLSFTNHAQNDMAFKMGTNICHPEGGARRISKKNRHEILRFAQNDKKCAFTMAEVLITLGVIGIVAAMTLPALIQKQQKMIAANQLKVAYTKLFNAIKMAEAKEGEAKYWTYFDENLSRSENSWNWTNWYLAPYIKNYSLYQDDKLHGCKNITYKNPDGTIAECSSVKGFCDVCSTSSNSVMTQIHFGDGTIAVILLRQLAGGYSRSAEIDVDINGYKGPNTWEKDIFRFYIGEKTNYQLSGYNTDATNYARSILLRECKEKPTSACTALVMRDGWEFKEDYPWY